MFRDADEAPAGATPHYDLCIVGAGAAGIALARRLRGTRARVCVLESGGLAPDPRTQELYRGASSGRGRMGNRYLMDSRLRYFGGSTNHWASWCAPLDPLDFERRAWVPGSGWPLSRAELEPFYRDAQEVCGLGPWGYDIARWRGPAAAAPPFEPGDFEVRMWQRSARPLRFGARYREELERAPNLEVWLRANAVHLALDRDGGRLERVEVATLAGRRFAVHARLFALACGGLENARLLLASRDVAPHGIGNQADQVGRHYLDHPHPASVGTAVLADEATRRALSLRDTPLSPDDPDPHLFATSCLAPGPGLQRSRGLLAGSYGVDDALVGSGADDARAVQRVFEHAGGGRPGAGRLANLIAILEQSPHPESRVGLDESRRDELGMPRLRLDWRFAALDRESLLRSLAELALRLGRSGRGRLRIAPWLQEGAAWPGDAVLGGFHHLGTTRMSASPRQGVVDADCRVHGVANLYVAGSSVFPTSGRVNPTLTLVALALRLADHLARLL